MSSQSSKNPLLRISETGEMRLRNKVGHAILTENAYEDRALNARLQTLTSHKNRHEQYMTSRQLEFATKRITASEERPHTIATGENYGERLSSVALPPIESKRIAFSESRCTAPDLTHDKPRTQAKWEKALTLVRLAVQSRQSRDTNSRAFITQQTGQKDLQGPSDTSTVLPPLTPNFKSRSQRRKRKAKRLTLPEMLRVSREMSRTGIEDSRFQNLEDCLRGGLKLSGSGQSVEGTGKKAKSVHTNNVRFAKHSGVRTL